MDTTHEILVLNDELNVQKDRRDFLTYPSEGFVDCTFTELEDGVLFSFNTTGLKTSNEIFSKGREDQLRFLINCAELERLYKEYNFSLSTENLLVDINLRSKILLRDTKNGSTYFLTKYKALVGSILLKKYTYDDFIKGGNDLYGKNKSLQELSKMESVAEIREYLLAEYGAITDDIAKNYCMTSKRKVWISRIATPILCAALVVATLFSGWTYFYDTPNRRQIVIANEAYIANNHLAVQRALADFSVQRLTHETKHILARSYVSTEPISISQRDTILSGLTLMADTTIFDYWIHIGRLEFDYAIDIAQRFGDSELLLFAFIKQEAFVRADPHMPGTEKVDLLSYLERRIDEIQRGRDIAEEAMNNNIGDNSNE